MPLGRKTTTAISSPPNRNSRALPPPRVPRLLFTVSLSGSIRNAPNTGPHSVAFPPTSSVRMIWTLIRIAEHTRAGR